MGASAAMAAQPASASGFQPTSASFLSASTGRVLGGVNCLLTKPCAATLASTTDGGAHWQVAAVPGVRLDQAGQVLFASRQIGWIYGTRQLWATHDGGRTWQRRQAGMGVQAMAVAGQTVYAVLTPDPGSKQPGGLYASPLSHSSWSLVRGVSGSFATLTSFRRTVWFGTTPTTPGGPSLVFMRTKLGPWHRHSLTCPGRDYSLSSIAAASRARVAYLCTDTGDFGMTTEGVRVLVSADAGRTTRLAGHWVPTISGSGGVLAMAPGNPRVITFATPPGAIGAFGRSTNGGRTWHAIKSLGLRTWSSLSYVSRTTGFVVGLSANGSASDLLGTTNTGRTWQVVHLPQVGHR